MPSVMPSVIQSDNGASDAAEQLVSAIRILLRVFTVDETRFPAAGGQVKYNALDFQTLYYVGENSGCSGAALARYLGTAPTTAQSVIERLVRRGLLRRKDGQKRAIALSLTPAGEEVREAIYRQDLHNCMAMLCALPDGDQAQFAGQMAAIARTMDEDCR